MQRVARVCQRQLSYLFMLLLLRVFPSHLPGDSQPSTVAVGGFNDNFTSQHLARRFTTCPVPAVSTFIKSHYSKLTMKFNSIHHLPCRCHCHCVSALSPPSLLQSSHNSLIVLHTPIQHCHHSVALVTTELSIHHVFIPFSA